MKKDYYCPYSILDTDIICEHKYARIAVNNPLLHNHDGYEILLFLHGDAQLFVESETRKLERGDLVIIPPHVFHGNQVMEIEHYERIVLNFRPQVLERIEDEETSFASVLTPPFPQKFNHFSLSDKQVDEMINILGRLEKSLCKNMFGHTVLSRACLAEFLVTLANYNSNNTVAESQNAMMPVVKKIFDFIDKNLYNELTVEIIARELHHNSDYLGRVFKNYVGDSLKYYINAKKVALAQQLLMEGVPPYDVCFTLCFNNYSSFSRCFSKHTGLSPKQYVMSLKTPSSI